MAKYKYMPDTPAADVLKIIMGKLNLDICNKNDPKSGYAAFAFFDKIVDKGGTAMDMAAAIPDESWVVWDLTMLGEETEPKVRKVLIDKITDPMIAFKLFTDLDFWTDEEDSLLEAKFKGKLPQAEQELKDDIVSRSKNG